VDGAIHTAGGPAIIAECRKIGSCPTGGACITIAGNLRAKYVIHAVGPVYHGGMKGAAALLKGAYQESMQIADARGLKSVAFPAISTGAYGYPVPEAARIALKTVIDFLKGDTSIDLVRFVLFGRKTYDVFAEEVKTYEKELSFIL
jgi:O-acetyl-ADP-ribose deacetylase (regulator of RNase III)